MEKRKFFAAAVLLLAIATAATAGSTEKLILKVEADNLAGAYLGLGDFLYSAGAYSQAKTAFENSLELEESATAHHSLGVAYSSMGNAEKAEEEFREAIQLDPEHAPGHNSLAILLFRQNKLEQAASHFREAARLSPESAQAHFDLGVSLANNFRQGNGKFEDLIEARDSFLTAAKLDTTHPHASSNAEVITRILAAYQ